MLSGDGVGDWEERGFKDVVDLASGRDNWMIVRIFEGKVKGIGALLHLCQVIYLRKTSKQVEIEIKEKQLETDKAHRNDIRLRHAIDSRHYHQFLCSVLKVPQHLKPLRPPAQAIDFHLQLTSCFPKSMVS
jgi:hypothetical protein